MWSVETSHLTDLGSSLNIAREEVQTFTLLNVTSDWDTVVQRAETTGLDLLPNHFYSETHEILNRDGVNEITDTYENETRVNVKDFQLEDPEWSRIFENSPEDGLVDFLDALENNKSLAFKLIRERLKHEEDLVTISDGRVGIPKCTLEEILNFFSQANNGLSRVVLLEKADETCDSLAGVTLLSQE